MAFYDYHKYEAKLTQREINAYDDWKASRYQIEHAHDCADCGQWIKDCPTYHCEDRGKPMLCEACKAKAA
jgi:hypothetical protein